MLLRASLLFVSSLAACGSPRAPALGDPRIDGTIVPAHIVSRVADRGVADDAPKRARADEGVVLYAALEVRSGQTTRWYSDAGTLRIDGRELDARPIAEAPAFTITWSKIEPVQKEMSNEASGSFRYERIDYAATVWAAGTARLDADVRPTLTPDHGDGLGTMRYRIEVHQDGHVVESPGVEARRPRAAGGLTDDVHRVSLRRDDSYVGYLTELYGQPYIWASAGASDATHQSERLEGADCADFVVYGARRLGRSIPYTWTGALPDYSERLAAGSLADDGVYRDARGKPVPFTGVGDLVLFPRHVGVLTADHGTAGVLDADDMMVHAYFDTPKEQRLGESAYARRPLELRRWKTK